MKELIDVPDAKKNLCATGGKQLHIDKKRNEENGETEKEKLLLSIIIHI